MTLTETKKRGEVKSIYLPLSDTLSTSVWIVWHHSYLKLSPTDLSNFCANFTPVLATG